MAKKLGCSTILYGGFSLGEALQGISETGYQSIELCARPSTAPHVEMDRAASYYTEIKQKVTDYGLVIESLAGTGGIEFGSDNFDRVIEVADLLGAPAIAIGSGGKSDDQESWGKFLNAINRVSLLTSQADIKLTIKPHVGNAVYSSETIIQFMQEVDRNWVGINYDASHIYRSGEGQDPVEVLDIVKEYVITLRIRDNRDSRQKPIGPVKTQIPGRGVLDLPAITEIMNTIDHVDYVIVEIVGTHAGTDTPLDQVQEIIDECHDYLNPFFD